MSMDKTSPEPWHGTLNGYTNRGCRLECCASVQREYRRQYAASHREQSAETNRAWRERNAEKLSQTKKAYDADPTNLLRKRARRFGISLEQLNELLEDAACAICGTSEPGGNGGWHIDHDHQCCPTGKGCCGKCIRGVLCHKHNVGLGHFDDDPELLRAAADYLSYGVGHNA